MVNPKTLKYKKKYNKRFTNKRKNNKFRHTKKIYKKKRHTTLKHKKIQRGGGYTLLTNLSHPEHDVNITRNIVRDRSTNLVSPPDDTSTDVSTVKNGLLSKFQKDFTEQYPNKDIPDEIHHELKGYADSMMMVGDFKEKLKEKRKELFSQQTNTQNEQDTSKPKQHTTESTYWFDLFSSYLPSLPTESLKQLRKMINDAIEARIGGGGT